MTTAGLVTRIFVYKLYVNIVCWRQKHECLCHALARRNAKQYSVLKEEENLLIASKSRKPAPIVYHPIRLPPRRCHLLHAAVRCPGAEFG
ncbi:hypothetical protein Ddye_030733 [Dipteronia dyeriana]|uniref:Uncharacterized protein n=1 Tax=Dipteronia dyeriana TaxID=168575 RepID=A0AAD9WLU8_9ROSI|nr:hypothetical protein Ddye_030733 [Dipteronia dyeriana]